MHRSQRIYVVDDDPEVLQVLERFLSQAGFEVRTASDGTGLLGALHTFQPDLIVLDLGLPGDDGLTLTRWIREASDIPIIMLTGRVEEVDRIVGLELGADDYVTKPFSPRELLARIKAVLRRTGRASSDDQEPIGAIKATVVSFAGWKFNLPDRRLISPIGAEVKLTEAECSLLAAFVTAPQQVLTPGELLARSRKYSHEILERRINGHVCKLRKKVKEKGKGAELIGTEWGAGYFFIPSVERIR